MPAGFSTTDVEQILPSEAFSAIERLCHTGVAEERGNRVDLLPPIRNHAARHYPPDNDDSDRLVAYIERLSRRFGEQEFSLSQVEWDQIVFQDYENIRLLFLTALAQSRVEELRACLQGFGKLAVHRGDDPSIFAEASKFFSACDDKPSLALCHSILAALARGQSNDGTALSAVKAALRLNREAGLAEGRADCLVLLGQIEADRGALGAAERKYGEARRVYRAEQLPAKAVEVTFRLARLAEGLGQPRKAKARFRDAIQEFNALRNTHGEAEATLYFATYLTNRHEHGEAAKLLSQAASLYGQTGDIFSSAYCLMQIGEMLFDMNEGRRAAECYEAARQIYEKLGREDEAYLCAMYAEHVAVHEPYPPLPGRGILLIPGRRG